MTNRVRDFLAANKLWELPDAAAFGIAAILMLFVIVWFNDFRYARGQQQAEFERRLGVLLCGVGAIGAIYVLVRFVKWAWSLEY